MVNSLVSIILPVYNGESTISASIESILQQSYQNFELIIIDDGSSDNSLKQMKQFKDKRIIINTQNNNGLAKTLNYGISVAKGELIARQDQDDISLPTRIEKQVERFYANKKLVLLGTNALVINENNQYIGRYRFPHRNMDLQFLTNFYNPFVHTSVMMKKQDFEIIGGYAIDPKIQPPEDFDLWNRMKKRGEVENLKEYLVHYRKSPNTMSHTYKDDIDNNYRELVVVNLQNLFSLSKKEAETFFKLQFTDINQISMSQRIKIFFKYLVEIKKFWFKPNSMGFRSYLYTLKMLGKIILK
jgi:glycosyltransferase involved in cell wall biosynthesis